MGLIKRTITASDTLRTDPIMCNGQTAVKITSPTAGDRPPPRMPAARALSPRRPRPQPRKRSSGPCFPRPPARPRGRPPPPPPPPRSIAGTAKGDGLPSRPFLSLPRDQEGGRPGRSLPRAPTRPRWWLPGPPPPSAFNARPKGRSGPLPDRRHPTTVYYFGEDSHLCRGKRAASGIFSSSGFVDSGLLLPYFVKPPHIPCSLPCFQKNTIAELVTGGRKEVANSSSPRQESPIRHCYDASLHRLPVPPHCVVSMCSVPVSPPCAVSVQLHAFQSRCAELDDSFCVDLCLADSSVPVPSTSSFPDKFQAPGAAHFLLPCACPFRKGSWLDADRFMAGCRPIIGLDDTHIKTSISGVLLCAISIDDNNNMFPIAYAYVLKENTK
ncbi:hypothetical protein KSP39_PZI011431 [Platanthera zijinensis]|uniref:Uncharacterized protein n=1 Tax=Platanthera zijinensis TaxID=2320716 RepID=A0AAP0BHQ2_9ASPA